MAQIKAPRAVPVNINLKGIGSGLDCVVQIFEGIVRCAITAGMRGDQSTRNITSFCVFINENDKAISMTEAAFWISPEAEGQRFFG